MKDTQLNHQSDLASAGLRSRIALINLQSRYVPCTNICVTHFKTNPYFVRNSSASATTRTTCWLCRTSIHTFAFYATAHHFHPSAMADGTKDTRSTPAPQTMHSIPPMSMHKPFHRRQRFACHRRSLAQRTNVDPVRVCVCACLRSWKHAIFRSNSAATRATL